MKTGNKTFEPILIHDGTKEADNFILKIQRLASELKKLKADFIEFAEPLGGVWNKQTAKTAINGVMVTLIDNLCIDFIGKQNKYLRNAVDKELARSRGGFDSKLYAFNNAVERSRTDSIYGYYPSELISSDFLPINDVGEIVVTDEYKALVKEQFNKYITNEEDAIILSSVKSLLKEWEEMKSKLGNLSLKLLASMKKDGIDGSDLKMPSGKTLAWAVEQNKEKLNK
ncbi:MULTISPECIES: hypothetical protein [Olivibacter]|uniref:Nucleotide modification associated domain-containing protein n=1 Tax=Olivibacter jilunii TaxID=985016 RepID=A0ABW6AYB3_9SPHI